MTYKYIVVKQFCSKNGLYQCLKKKNFESNNGWKSSCYDVL